MARHEQGPTGDDGAQLSRRSLVRGVAAGLGSLALGGKALAAGSLKSLPLLDAAARDGNPPHPRVPHFEPRARRIIYLHMAGSPSQLDLFDHKPKLDELDGKPVSEELIAKERFAFIKGVPKILASPYTFSRHGESGQSLSELLPHLGGIADEICIVRSMVTHQFNHAPAQILMNTGHERIGRPSMGSWLDYALGSENPDLPGFVVMLSGTYAPSGGASCWGSGFLPTVHQGVRFRSKGDPVLFLSNPPGISARARRRSLDAINALNRRRLEREGDPEIATRIAQYEMANRMQSSMPELLELDSEPEEVREMYGVEAGKVSFANNCLLARRLAERGVRFIQLYHWGWDSHGTSPGDDIVTSLRERCEQTDRASAALVRDLRQRGMLDDTLIVWGGEFGRTPMNEERNGSKYLGRDHHPHAFTIWLAGGGIRPGHSIGETDELGYHVVSDPISVHDLHATLLHQFGFDHERLVYRFQGRDFRLTDVSGQVVEQMLA